MCPACLPSCVPVLRIPLERVASCCSQMVRLGVRMLIRWEKHWIGAEGLMLFWPAVATCPKGSEGSRRQPLLRC